MLKKVLFICFISFIAVLPSWAQDDELPPPSSKPQEETKEVEELKKADEEFQPFKKHKKIDLSKFIIEPGFNLAIQPSMIDLGLSPYVGYNFWKGLCAGGGINYRFTRFNVQTDPDPVGRVYYGKAVSHIYGGGVFLQYNIWRGIFARARFELLHRTGDDYLQGTVNIIPQPNGNYKMEFPKMNKTIPALLLGVGYNVLRSKNFFFPLMVSYDLLHPIVDKRYSLYRTGWVIQLGFVNLF